MTQEASDTHHLRGNQEKMWANQTRTEKRAIWIYHWLFGSVIITVPWMLIDNYFIGSWPSTLERIIAVLMPALVHLVLLRGLRSPHLYIRRHTQQGSMMLALRICSALLFIALLQSFCLWFLASTVLWLGGSLLGWTQVRRGDCWLMRRKGEVDQLPRPWAAKDAIPSKKPRVMAEWTTPAESQVEGKPRAQPLPRRQVSHPSAKASNVWECWEAYALGENLVNNLKSDEAVASFMFAYRHGSPELRKKATEALTKLGEVELF